MKNFITSKIHFTSISLFVFVFAFICLCLFAIYVFRQNFLFYSCKNGNYPLAKTALLLGSDVNQKNADYNNYSPLNFCASKNYCKIARLLLRNGANVNTKDGNNVTPLLNAVHLSYYEMAKLLLENGANVNAREGNNDTPLIKACINNKKKIIVLLVENKADVNCKNNQEYSPLFFLTRKGNLDIVKYLISKGAKIDINSDILLSACYSPSDNVEMIEFLLGKGFKLKPELLMATASQSTVNNVAFFIKRGLNVNSQDEWGLTPLMLACNDYTSGNSFSKVELLIKSGSNPNLKTKHLVAPSNLNYIISGNFPKGSTALMFVVQGQGQFGEMKTLKLAEYLLKHGADVNIVNSANETALDIALKWDDKKISTLLKKYGAKIAEELKKEPSTVGKHQVPGQKNPPPPPQENDSEKR